MKKLIRRMLCIGIAAWLLCIQAAAAGSAVWGSIQGQTAILYLAGASAEDNLNCQVGSTPAEIASKTKVNTLDAPMETIILLDNSFSIPPAQRTIVTKVLEDLIANRLNGEKFTIATISDQVTYLCEGASDYSQLKNIIQNLQYQNQNTQLTDGLYKVLDKLSKADAGVLRRVLLVSDGVDNKQIGYTREELNQMIQKTGYPLYTIGCTDLYDTNNTEKLQNLFALSRLTYGNPYHVEAIQDSMMVVNAMLAWNQALRIDVRLPDTACDGSKKVLQVSKDGTPTYTLELTMPIVQEMAKSEAPAPAPAPAPEPIPQPEPEESSNTTLIVIIAVLAVLLVVVIIVVVIFALRGKKKPKDTFERLPAEMTPEHPYGGETEIMGETEQGEKTAMMWDETPSGVLVLRDSSDPNRRFEIPIQGIIAIGRDTKSCRIALGNEPTVARHQCDIFEQNGRIMLRNISTSNITCVNSQKVMDDCELLTGSIIKMGRVIMNVEII